MEEKVVHMVLKVDLQCNGCYKKVRKILSKLRQIRDQVYDEKQGTILIKVVSSTPEKIMSKISRKGDRSINSIHIKEPEKKNEEGKDPKKPCFCLIIDYPKVVAQPDRYNSPLLSISSNSSYEGRPFYQYQNYGIPAAPPSYVERPIYDSYGGGDGGRGYNVGQPSNYHNQENSTGCSVM